MVRDDGINVTGSAAPRRGSEPAMAPRPTTVADEVGSMTVDEVLDAVDEGRFTMEEAVAAERAGRQRAGILTLADTVDG